MTLDEFSKNNIHLVDFELYQISINDLLIFQNQLRGENFGKIGLLDCGSSLGSWLNGFSLSQATVMGSVNTFPAAKIHSSSWGRLTLSIAFV